jgi:23S rRNA (uridine2552-2'-O)-methyltransferase
LAVKDRARLDDHWSRLARKEGYPARSVWKLEEIDRKHALMGPGGKVLDLGAAPGGWTLYAAGRVGPEGLVAAVDLAALAATGGRGLPPQVRPLQADLLEADPSLVADWAPFDAVLSDMAPKTTGRREVDQARSAELARKAWEWAQGLLGPGGAFLFKIFESPEADALAREVAAGFRRQARIKPKATRGRSLEIYVLGLGFRGPEGTRGGKG